MAETMKKTMWWWPWQTDKVEAALEDMAGRGWRLVYVRGACTSFVFQKAEPARVRYCMDYQEKERPEYMTLLADAGWKMEYKSSGWYIWSQAYTDVKPELFTDVDSLMRRNNAILGSLTAVFAAQIPLIVANMNHFDTKSPVVLGFMISWALLEAILAGTVIGMAMGTQKLRQRASKGGR